MKALIIAAGDGDRLGELTKKTPKPLIKVYGLSLIERVILTAKKVGFKEFYIVVGYLKDKIINYLKEGKKLGVKINYIENNHWEKGNAYSLLSASKVLKERFTLLMADHIFDYRILKGLLENYQNDKIVNLAVDRRRPSPEDTKVYEKNNLIIDIGKKIKKSNAVDRGIFICQPEIFDYAKKAIKSKKYELADIIKSVSQDKKASVFDISGYGQTYVKKLRKNIELWCIDVDTQHDINKLKNKLIDNISKNPSDLIAALINKSLENFLVRYISYLPFTANQITIFVNLLAYIVTLFYLKGFILAGLILSFVVGVLDGLDGKIARLKIQESKVGELEHSFDFLFESSWIIALGYYLTKTENNFNYILIASIIITLTAFYRFIYDRFSKIKQISLDVVDKNNYLLRKIFARRNIFNLAILIAFLINQLKNSLFYILILCVFTSIIYSIKAINYLKDES